MSDQKLGSRRRIRGVRGDCRAANPTPDVPGANSRIRRQDRQDLLVQHHQHELALLEKRLFPTGNLPLDHCNFLPGRLRSNLHRRIQRQDCIPGRNNPQIPHFLMRGLAMPVNSQKFCAFPATVPDRAAEKTQNLACLA
jgi:hypothetical protein